MQIDVFKSEKCDHVVLLCRVASRFRQHEKDSKISKAIMLNARAAIGYIIKIMDPI